MTLLLRLSATLLALALLPGLAAAQAVAARVVDGASGRPVEGALVTLLDDTDHQQRLDREALVDPRGDGGRAGE
jgi:hypothetical protein